MNVLAVVRNLDLLFHREPIGPSTVFQSEVFLSSLPLDANPVGGKRFEDILAEAELPQLLSASGKGSASTGALQPSYE